MKFFNTAGPVNRQKHYKLDPLTRWDLDRILSLIDQEKYFILHAPRQTGKTSCLLALQNYLNSRDDYHCVYANFESGQSARNDINTGIEIILSELHASVQASLTSDIPFSDTTVLADAPAGNGLNIYLRKLCQWLNKPLILLIDEIDALVGDTLISVLRQLRSGYTIRPALFPQAVILCGVRDIKDYRIHCADNDIITGGSCFNIKAESLVLGNFSEAEVRQLYNEHTKATGQKFTDECFPLLMRYTAGQPWLINALGNEVTFKMQENRDPAIVITPKLIEIAKEQLIISRATHLDQLTDKLKEERVRRVIEPLLVGAMTEAIEDDIEYCIDLGLVSNSPRGIIISNEIYREILPRELSKITQSKFLPIQETITDIK
jgi:hypothetical protein